MLKSMKDIVIIFIPKYPNYPSYPNLCFYKITFIRIVNLELHFIF